MSDRVRVVLIKCRVHIIRVEVPQVMGGKPQVFGVTTDLAEEENMAVALLDGSLRWIKEFFHLRVISGQEMVVEIEDTCSAYDIASPDLRNRAILAGRGVAD